MSTIGIQQTQLITVAWSWAHTIWSFHVISLIMLQHVRQNQMLQYIQSVQMVQPSLRSHTSKPSTLLCRIEWGSMLLRPNHVRRKLDLCYPSWNDCTANKKDKKGNVMKGKSIYIISSTSIASIAAWCILTLKRLRLECCSPVVYWVWESLGPAFLQLLLLFLGTRFLQLLGRWAAKPQNEQIIMMITIKDIKERK